MHTKQSLLKKSLSVALLVALSLPVYAADSASAVRLQRLTNRIANHSNAVTGKVGASVSVSSASASRRAPSQITSSQVHGAQASSRSAGFHMLPPTRDPGINQMSSQISSISSNAFSYDLTDVTKDLAANKATPAWKKLLNNLSDPDFVSSAYNSLLAKISQLSPEASKQFTDVESPHWLQVMDRTSKDAHTRTLTEQERTSFAIYWITINTFVEKLLGDQSQQNQSSSDSNLDTSNPDMTKQDFTGERVLKIYNQSLASHNETLKFLSNPPFPIPAAESAAIMADDAKYLDQMKALTQTPATELLSQADKLKFLSAWNGVGDTGTRLRDLLQKTRPQPKRPDGSPL